MQSTKLPRWSLFAFMIIFIVMIAESWFLAFSYDQWVAKDQRWIEWGLLNAFIAFISWLFVYRGMCDQRPVVITKKTK
jgi:hypothetical protein